MAQTQPVPNPICGPSIRGIVSPSTSPLQAAYADFIGSLTRRSPLAIPIDPHPFAFEDRAEHVKGVLEPCLPTSGCSWTIWRKTLWAASIDDRSTPCFRTSHLRWPASSKRPLMICPGGFDELETET